MTYEDLKGFIDTLSQSQLRKSVTVFDTEQDAYYEVCDAYEEEDSDVIDCEDVAHPVLELRT